MDPTCRADRRNPKKRLRLSALLSVMALVSLASSAERTGYGRLPLPGSDAPGASGSAWRDDREKAIVVEDYRRFELEDVGRATTNVRRVVRILRPDGREYGVMTVYHDGYRKIKRFKGRIIDNQGRVVQKLKNDHIEDVAAVPGQTLYQEGRYRTARLYHPDYPYTVEFEFEIEHRGLLSWPTWYPGERDVRTQHARFEIVAPAEVEIRYAQRGNGLVPTAIRESQLQTLVWEIVEMPPFDPEPWGPSWHQQRPAVITAPAVFEIEGVAGEMASWSGLADWYRRLMLGRAQLSDEIKREINDLVAGVSDTLEIARLVYGYVQQRTRYISVQLGIGRWQPEEAMIVHERAYGDCKALTNYTLALLEEVGVPAFPALIQSGFSDPQPIDDFPCFRFNHVVLLVPAATDSVWLECTSQTTPFGHIGAANENRWALVVKGGESQLVRTPSSTSRENRLVRTGLISLRVNGDAVGTVAETYTGNQADQVRHSFGGKASGWRENVRDFLDVADVELLNAVRVRDGVRSDTVIMKMDMKLPGLGSRSGSRLFVKANAMGRWKSVPRDIDDRTQPVVFPFAFEDVDSLEYVLPDGFEIEALPKAVEVETGFGYFRSAVVPNDRGAVGYSRVLRIESSRIPAEDYPDVVQFFKTVVRADTRQIVLRRI